MNELDKSMEIFSPCQGNKQTQFSNWGHHFWCRYMRYMNYCNRSRQKRLTLSTVIEEACNDDWILYREQPSGIFPSMSGHNGLAERTEQQVDTSTAEYY